MSQVLFIWRLTYGKPCVVAGCRPLQKSNKTHVLVFCKFNWTHRNTNMGHHWVVITIAIFCDNIYYDIHVWHLLQHYMTFMLSFKLNYTIIRWYNALWSEWIEKQVGFLNTCATYFDLPSAIVVSYPSSTTLTLNTFTTVEHRQTVVSVWSIVRLVIEVNTVVRVGEGVCVDGWLVPNTATEQ